MTRLCDSGCDSSLGVINTIQSFTLEGLQFSQTLPTEYSVLPQIVLIDYSIFLIGLNLFYTLKISCWCNFRFISLSVSELKVETLFFLKSGQKGMLFPKLERFNLHHYKYELRPCEFGENNLQYITWYGVQRVDQVMVDTVVWLGVRLQFRCDKHNTKFQRHENLSLLSSHRNMKATFPKVLSRKGGKVKYHSWVKSKTNRNVACL